MKRIGRLAKQNLLMVFLALSSCLSISVSAYLGSDSSGLDNNWSVAITHVPSTPTSTLVPETGWWTAIATPTPKK